MLKKVFEFTKDKKNMVIYGFNDLDELSFDKWNVKNVQTKAVLINHYTFDGNFLRKVTDGEHDILIREETLTNGETLLMEAYIQESLIKNEDTRSKYVCDLIAKKALNLSMCG